MRISLPHTASGALLASAALLSAGCAGSGSRGPNGEPTQAARGVQRLPKAEGHAADVRATGPQRARQPHGLVDDEVAASGAKLPDPCALVSRAQAQSILHAAVSAPVLAPQGPTCVYASRNSKQQVTLEVESGLDAVALRPKLHDRMRVKVGSRHAYCGAAGVPVLRIPVSGGRIISVSAPCPIAAAFAGDALSHLSATGA